jgi:hypothetical protein
MLTLAGDTTIDCSVGAGLVTVSVAWPVTPLMDAVIVDVPAATPDASPLLLIVATDVLADTQVTVLVRFCVELSENIPVAVNCWVCPFTMLGLAGVTEIDWSVGVGLVTVSVVWPVTPLSDAVIVDVPAATPVASPALLIVATPVLADAQVTWFVRFCIELSENVPVAVNCCVDPLVMLGFVGVTEIDCSVGELEATFTVADIPPAVPSPLSKPWIVQ